MSRRAIDWADVHRRLERTRAALSEEPGRGSERFAAIMAERTRRIAATAERGAEKTAALLVCRIGGERYALPLEEVAEVATLGGLALPPRAPPALLGAMNLRGAVLRVFDLGRLLTLDGSGEPGGHVAVLRRQDFPTGLRVDRVERIETLSAGRIAAGAAADRQNRFTRSIVDGLLILDPDKIAAEIARQGN